MQKRIAVAVDEMELSKGEVERRPVAAAVAIEHDEIALAAVVFRLAGRLRETAVQISAELDEIEDPVRRHVSFDRLIDEDARHRLDIAAIVESRIRLDHRSGHDRRRHADHRFVRADDGYGCVKRNGNNGKREQAENSRRAGKKEAHLWTL